MKMDDIDRHRHWYTNLFRHTPGKRYIYFFLLVAGSVSARCHTHTCSIRIEAFIASVHSHAKWNFLFFDIFRTHRSSPNRSHTVAYMQILSFRRGDVRIYGGTTINRTNKRLRESEYHTHTHTYILHIEYRVHTLASDARPCSHFNGTLFTLSILIHR